MIKNEMDKSNTELNAETQLCSDDEDEFARICGLRQNMLSSSLNDVKAVIMRLLRKDEDKNKLSITHIILILE